MKMSVLLATALLAMVSHSAAAADPVFSQPREKAVMLYFSKSFGSGQARNLQPLAFGLRFQQASAFDVSRPVALLDARYSLGGRNQLLIGGLNAFDTSDASGKASSEDSSGGPSGSDAWSKDNPGWTIAMVVAAVLVGGCLIDWCDSGGGGPETPGDTSTPGTGG